MSELVNERICDNCKRPFGDHFWPSLGGRCTQNPAGTKFIPIAEPSPEPEAAREYVYVANPYPTHYMNTPMVYPLQPDAAPHSDAAREVVRFAYLPIGARFRCGRAGTVVFQKTDEDHAASLEHPDSEPFDFELSHPCNVVAEATPASEAQAPAVPDERPKCPDCNSVGMSHCSDPEHCGGVYWPDSKYQALRDELAQLRTRVAILDAQEVELPKLANDVFDNRNDNNLAASLQEDKAERVFDSKWEASRLLGWWLEQRERQLLDAQRAVQAFRGVARGYRESHQNGQPYYENGRLSCPCKHCAAYDALAEKGE